MTQNSIKDTTKQTKTSKQQKSAAIYMTFYSYHYTDI